MSREPVFRVASISVVAVVALAVAATANVASVVNGCPIRPMRSGVVGVGK